MAPVNANGSFMLARSQSAYGPLTKSAGKEKEPGSETAVGVEPTSQSCGENPMSRKVMSVPYRR